MLKKFRGYLQKGLTTAVTAAVLTGASFIHGCGPGVDPFYEVFRNDDTENTAPIAEPIKIDYSEYDNKHDYIIINNRAYLKDDLKPAQILEEIVDVPSEKVFKIPAINAEGIEDANDGLILQYRSKLPVEDLKKLIENYLKDIKIDTYSTQNTLIFNGKKKAFGDFKYITTLLNKFDLPAKQVRMKLSIVEFFNDNTSDRELALGILKNKWNIVSLNLPSMTDTTAKLTTGVSIYPFFNQRPEKYDLESAIKFLDSYGKTSLLSDVDILVANGQTVEFKNTTSIPYPEAIVVGLNVVDAIKYRETGTTVKMTPFANDEGFITIKLLQAESGEHTGYYGTFQRPTFRTADLKSEFTIRNGITYFAGTSLFTRYKEVKRGIPLVNTIPILGELFSSKSIEKSQSQLLYFIEARTIERDSLVGTEVKKIEEEVSPVGAIGGVSKTSEEEHFD